DRTDGRVGLDERRAQRGERRELHGRRQVLERRGDERALDVQAHLRRGRDVRLLLRPALLARHGREGDRRVVGYGGSLSKSFDMMACVERSSPNSVCFGPASSAKSLSLSSSSSSYTAWMPSTPEAIRNAAMCTRRFAT